MYGDSSGALEIERDTDRTLWLDARADDPEDPGLLSAAFNANFDAVVVRPELARDVKFPNETAVAVFADDLDAIDETDEWDVIVSDDVDVLREARDAGFETAIRSTIVDRETFEATIDHIENLDWVTYCLAVLEDETNIPLELIIAKLQDTDVRLLKRVADADEAGVAFGVMEVGTNGVLLSTDDPSEVYDLRDHVRTEARDQIDLRTLEITNVEHVGVGTRVCVDTTSMMSRTEGMLVGSTSAGGIFVCSETHPLPYMDLRPFRVNAGAAHSYIWSTDNVTKYLSELEAGSEVLCVDTEGNTRSLSVGRAKIEERPLLLIEAEAEDTPVNVFLQDDWHVRVMGADGEPINITELEPGDEVLGHVCEPGRHVGIKVSEDLMEH